jgi:hypothetical protein
VEREERDRVTLKGQWSFSFYIQIHTSPFLIMTPSNRICFDLDTFLNEHQQQTLDEIKSKLFNIKDAIEKERLDLLEAYANQKGLLSQMDPIKVDTLDTISTHIETFLQASMRMLLIYFINI